MIYDIIKYPKKILRLHCDLVIDFNIFTNEYIKMIQDACITFKGFAIAAPQINISKQFFVMSPILEDESFKNVPRIIINPIIIYKSEELFSYKESCLSIPGVHLLKKRPKHIKIKYKNENKEEKELECSDLFAYVCQHEYDHLNGKLFIDDLNFYEKNKVMKRINKLRKQK